MTLSFRLSLVGCLLLFCSTTLGEDGNRLAYLSEPYNAYYAHLEFPKLITPQWVGEDGVEAVVTLGIDDMRNVDEYETYLRPLLARLQEIDGRAPVSIMTCQVDPDHPHLQRWLKEGVSLETHTASHPCPCLQGGRLEDAKATYDECVDQLSAVPNSRPVAFRFPCCDSMNTPSPRAFETLLNQTTPAGNFIQMSSSVVAMLTADDPDLPRNLVLDADGSPRFTKYIPFPSFVNKVENYPYPFVVGGACWEFPIAVPDDWQGHNLQRAMNPKTIEDMKAVVDATVIKQGVANIVFHPHGWIRNDQMVELVDQVDKQYGKKVLFLTFRECLERLNQHLLAGHPLRTAEGGDNGVRLLDLNADGFLDVVIGNAQTRLTRLWDPANAKWIESEFPVALVHIAKNGRPTDSGVRFGILSKQGNASFLVHNDTAFGGWRFDGSTWVKDNTLLDGLTVDGADLVTSAAGIDAGVRLRDVDADGICELIVANSTVQAVFSRNASRNRWEQLAASLPAETRIVDADGYDAGLRFVDVNEDGYDDILFSNDQRWSLHLFESLAALWSDEVSVGKRGDAGAIPPLVRSGTNNGAWFANRHLWIQNEDTAKLPDGVDRRSFNELLGNRPARPKSPPAALQGIELPEGFDVQLVASEPLVSDPVDFDWGPDGRLWVVEMADYPLPIAGQENGAGRVRYLEDTDGDGVYDRSTLFLDSLNTPTGILVWRNGVLITAAPDVLYAEDTDGDGRADVREAIFTGFGKGNQQHRVNGLRWGLDNWVYLANGDSGGSISSKSMEKKLEIRGLDVRIRPDAGLVDAQAGQTQFGRNRDDWGNWFGCNNPNPVFQYLLADHYLRRNPFFAPPNPRVDIREGDDLCYPISRVISHCDPKFRPLDAPTKFTAANSTMVYRDELFGSSFVNNTFTSEPVYNLVHRRVLVPNGDRFASQRVSGEEHSEFMRSNDPWSRPTALHVGPDGALYVADMYRQVIEHPAWIDDELEKQIDVRAGADRGRIYRIAPVGVEPRQVPRLDELETPKLVAQLDSPSGWQRDLVQRMLIWRGDRTAIPLLEEMATTAARPLTRLHALCTLDGLTAVRSALITAALADAHPGVRRHALRLAEPFLRNLGGESTPLTAAVASLIDDDAPQVRKQLAYTLGEWKSPQSTSLLCRLAGASGSDEFLMAAVLSSVRPDNLAALRTAVATDSGKIDDGSPWRNHIARIERGFRRASQPPSTMPKQEMMKPATDNSPTVASNRQPIVDKFQGALALHGEAAQGKSLFAKHCSVCHRLEGIGHVVGPDLTALTNRTPEAMLVAILDPNRAVEDKYRGYLAVTEDGRVITGTISAETSNSVTLIAQEGKESVLLRSEIEELVPSGKSLMPEGMDQVLSVQEMANLIAYLAQSQGKAAASPASSKSSQAAPPSTPSTVAQVSAAPSKPGREQRPNILWITCEDMSPNLGCYGDSYARTPNLDAMAARSLRYTRAFAPTGVCATARSSLIMGMYASSLGTQAMRCQAAIPETLHPFPHYLRQAGYYCSNAAKTDYNFDPPANVWDANSRKGHWRNRPSGQPFFSVFNHSITHESRIRGDASLTAELKEHHDPAKANVPPYLPDTPAVRRDWARYQDLITVMDRQVAELLQQLDDDGLADDTIVFFFSDHGVGLPRAKQFIFDSGMQVPLLVHVPEKWKHLAPAKPGTALEQMVSFVDFAPSVLSLAGVPIPETMQGTAFLGPAAGPEREYIYGIRDRMDERIDMNRTVRGDRFKYHRNYMSHLPHFPWLDYMDMLDSSKEFRRLAKGGELTGGLAYFMAQHKSLEELYDLENDPYELKNLVSDPKYAKELARLREAHLAWVRRTVDTGLVPEHMLRTFAAGSSEYEYARSGKYPLERCIATARLLEQGDQATELLIAALADKEPPVRFWAATGLASLGEQAAAAEPSLIVALGDEHPEVALAAAEALCRMNKPERALPVIEKHLSDERQIVRVTAANIADRIDEQALPILACMRRESKTEREGKYQFFTSWILDRAIAELEKSRPQETSFKPGPLIDVGISSIDISPRVPIRLQGFPTAARSEETAEIAQRIHAKAIAFGSDEQGPTLLVVADLIGISGEISEQLFQRLKRRVGFDERARLTVASTHNHSGPTVDTTIPFIFRTPPTQEQAAHIKQYTAWLLDRLEEVAVAALQGRSPGRLAFSRGSVGFAINRRVVKDGQWTGFGHSPDGPVDHDLPLLTVYDSTGKLRAVWVNYACHGVCWHEPSVHGDWMGIARERFEAAHAGAIALITIGCAGDQNPLIPRSGPVELYGRQIIDEVERLLGEPQHPIRSVPTARLKRIELPLDPLPTVEQWALRNDWYGQTVSQQIKQGKTPPTTIPYVVQTWTYGEDLTQVFLAGEVVVDYSLRLKRELGRERLWVSAYANSQPAYIPSERMLPEGGYEVDRSRTSYGIPSRLGKGTEDRIIQTVHELVAAANEQTGTKRSLETVGVILLTAADAQATGPKIKYMPEHRALGWWTDQDHAQWNVNVDKAGRYDVVLTWSVHDASAGRPYLLSVDNQPLLKGTVKSTGDWEKYQSETIGQITLAAGQRKLALKPNGKFTKALMDLREMRLVPVR